MARSMICVGDTTTHGGRVLEGTATATIDGKPIAGVGHRVLCPQCKGVFPILPATGRRYSRPGNGHRGHEDRVWRDADRVAVFRDAR